MRKRLVDIFLKVANRQIIRQRAGRRLRKIKERFAERGVTSREECKKLVAEDWKDSMNIKSAEDEEALENITNIRFTFSF